jgi:predicted O-methyltransferase YrrM
MDFLDIERDELLAKWQWVLELVDHVPSWTSGHELAALAEAASRATHICEIGSHHGKSALVMALANPKAQIVAIDNCENADTEQKFKKNLSTQIESGQLRFIKGTSDWLKAAKMRKPFDLCFIDGGHLEADVAGDIANLKPRMAPGGLMLGHDWRVRDMNDGVNVAVMKAFGRPQVFESVWSVRLP